ncbi:DNA mismatch repair protein MutL [Colletotrichum orbiculare MAFF 240422]|uniref:DNA mismatch repair protein MutL n=1 Tax=Colletotrichum orbiculare (strain 104-T / ATCC 96160 / CBS 514.97 / LARS 414 / MAFF 240422) TaxID=1213857 RepID=A0A484FL02_COLOR|nr:DNA mismatch repair protein MutL [Colletotrichum orbiculare MAFF 240422]
MSIQPLPEDVIRRIRSSATITSLNGVVCSLLKNCLDAGATRINITVDYSRGNCVVEDDGQGIVPSEFRENGGLAKLYHTSRRSSGNDFYGINGNFLASLSALSLLSITSHHHSHNNQSCMTIHNSKVLARSIPALPEQRLLTFDHGTRVVISTRGFRRRAQFISLGIRPVANEHGINVLYTEVNRVFINSGFAIIEESRSSGDQAAGQGADAAKSRRPKRGSDRWPMFYFRLGSTSAFQSDLPESAEDLLGHRNRDLADIVDLLKPMRFEFSAKESKKRATLKSRGNQPAAQHPGEDGKTIVRPLAPGTSGDEGEINWVSRFHGCPQGILDLLNSRACRTAIMFNDILSKDECENLAFHGAFGGHEEFGIRE